MVNNEIQIERLSYDNQIKNTSQEMCVWVIAG